MFKPKVIEIRKSATADSRTCDVTQVSKDTLLASSKQHIDDVEKAMRLFIDYMDYAADVHDYDKVTEIDWFFANFQTKFEDHSWLDNHYKIHRHHWQQPAGVPEKLNLMDILEGIADSVMAGMARAGSIYPINISDELLREAYNNTVAYLQENVKVVD